MRSYCLSPSLRSPGLVFEYNNCDYVLLGKILEEIDGVSWFQSLDQRILKPSGMLSVRVGKNNGDETVAGFLNASKLAPPVALDLYEASAELVGTVEDLAKFDQALLNNLLINKESRKRMWESKPEYGYAALGQWVFPVQLRGCDQRVKLIERRGAISGIKTLNILVPEYDKIVIAFVNRENFDWGAVWAREGFAYDLISDSVCDRNRL